jgi:hypothetical protein
LFSANYGGFVLESAPAGSLLSFLSQVPDPRGAKGTRHPLTAMLAAVVCAMLQGCRGYSAIEDWVHEQEVSFWHELGFTRTPPKLGAFRKLLMKLPSDSLEQVLTLWIEQGLGLSLSDSDSLSSDTVTEGAEELQAVALDGKTLRGSLQQHERAVHLIEFLDQKTGYVLSQQRVDEKTNEHKGALELLKSIVLTGRVITGDAMFCQRDLCQEIRDRGGHYFFVVKDNQPSLKESITAEFRAAFSPCNRTVA